MYAGHYEKLNVHTDCSIATWIFNPSTQNRIKIENQQNKKIRPSKAFDMLYLVELNIGRRKQLQETDKQTRLEIDSLHG